VSPVSPSLYERFELEPLFSVGAGALALVLIMVSVLRVRKSRSTIGLLGLGAGIAAALAWFANAWTVYDVAPTHTSTFGGCSFIVLTALLIVAVVLVLLTMAERRREGSLGGMDRSMASRDSPGPTGRRH
jgi:multisubunit Na+/H+ antiporter MnhB subunit